MAPLIPTLPWVAFLILVVLVVRLPSELPPRAAPRARTSGGEPEPPFVSVIVPARNERLNIDRCVASLTASEYPAFEVIVIDDRSDDETAALARALPRRNARRLLVVDGAELPDGWLGKPWACSQGAALASGELLLFTDADTTHGPALLERAVEGRDEEDADLLTVIGRQLMETFWERLVQPHIFLMMAFRFPDFERTARNGRWRDAIANGQFLLFRRASYDAIGGHGVVRDEVVEDLALAQHVKRAGLRLRIRGAQEDLETRMYRSLGDLVRGWSKNVFLGGQQSFPPLLRPLLVPVTFAGSLVMWLVPPAALLAALAGVGGPSLLTWSVVAYAVSAASFANFTHRMGAPWPLGLVYPLGTMVSLFILLRSWARGRTVEWKGRRYTMPSMADRA